MNDLFFFLLPRSHFFDHNRELHQEQLPHLRLFIRLKLALSSDSTIMAILQEYLLSVCDLCGQTCSSKTAKDKHAEFCVLRHTTLCLYYGEPLSSDIFLAKFGFEKNQEIIIDHLNNQLANIAEKIRTTEIAPNLASKVIGELDIAQRENFKRLLSESTVADLIVHEPVHSTTSESVSREETNQTGVVPSREALDELLGGSETEGATSPAELEMPESKKKKKNKAALRYKVTKKGKLWLRKVDIKRQNFAMLSSSDEEEEEKEEEEEEEEAGEDEGKKENNHNNSSYLW